jgi:hypothetical protein
LGRDDAVNFTRQRWRVDQSISRREHGFDATRRISAEEARRQARIALGKDPDDLSDVYRGRPTRPKKLKPIESPGRYVPAAPLSLADAASHLSVRPSSWPRPSRRARWRRFMDVAAIC